MYHVLKALKNITLRYDHQKNITLRYDHQIKKISKDHTKAIKFPQGHKDSNRQQKCQNVTKSKKGQKSVICSI